VEEMVAIEDPPKKRKFEAVDNVHVFKRRLTTTQSSVSLHALRGLCSKCDFVERRGNGAYCSGCSWQVLYWHTVQYCEGCKCVYCWKCVAAQATSSAPSVSVPAPPLEPAPGPFIAVDIHGCLDSGSRSEHIPTANKEAVLKLIQRGFRCWLLSYIGRAGPHSQSRREQAERQRREVAAYCSLHLEQPSKPRSHALFLEICDQRVSKAQHWNIWPCGGTMGP
jgi:hypothetical protein